MTSVLAACLAFAAPAQACTSFLLRAANGDPVYGRTMEFGIDLKSAMAVVPRNFAVESAAAPADKAAKWTTKYGYVGVNSYGQPAISDGMNEKGLIGGILYFPGFADYAEPAEAVAGKTLAPWEVVAFVLSQAATVAEAREVLATMTVTATPIPGGTYVLPLHYTFHDETGASLVVEPTGGVLKFFDNPLGVMTNSPSFDWHITNLRNYVKISPVNAGALDLGGVVIEPTGQGSGLLGIPGDPTPPSRFLRALGYVLSVERQPDGASTVRLAEHVLNNFDIPVGWIKNGPNEHSPAEITQWSTIADAKNRKYFVKTYDNQTLVQVDLAAQDLDAKAMKQAPLPAKVPVQALPF